jgi:hypothetical protein
MNTKNETDLLNELIINLKLKRAYELDLIKNQLHEVCESLTPSNLIKDVFHDITHSPEIKNNLTDVVIGLGTGFLFKKIFVGNSHHRGKKIVGTLIQFGVANIVTKHLDEIKLLSNHLFNKISESDLLKKHNKNNEFPI